MRARRDFLIYLTLLAAGCGGGEDRPKIETTLTVWNRAQSELLAVIVHDGEIYDQTLSVITEPLAVEARLELDFVQGQRLTVWRRKVELADPVAYTTARGLDEVDGEGFTLIVFDQSFRLLSPSQTP